MGGTAEDPRSSDDFQTELFPLCDGGDAPPPDSGNQTKMRMLEFAAAFYRINVCYDRLRRVRLRESEEDEAIILADIDAAAHARDALEDRYMPEGFYAEQELDGLRVKNLIFNHALKSPQPEVTDRSPEPLNSSSSFDIVIPLPPPPGVSMEDHVRKHLEELLGEE